MKKNIVITGEPKSGKSTLLRQLTEGVGPKIGFVTDEIREGGEQVGFAIETHLGNRFVLAHVGLDKPIRVSRYSVDVPALESAIPEVSVFQSEHLLYLDEIGQMQLFSQRFRELVLRFLDSSNTCLITLSCVYQDDFISSVKQRADVILIEITPENREEQGKFVAALLRKVEKARRYIAEPQRFTRKSINRMELRSEHGIRQLYFDGRDGGTWKCSCDFYQQYGICSHTIATMEFISDCGIRR